tara:strand:- start:142 stop:1926 length:1785 start_codon:yes stop_codon:yes gene_type:complete
MDEGKFAADFIAANIDSIWNIAKSSYTNFDETLKLKLKTSYSTYISNTREKYAKSRSFFIRSQPVDLYDYYVPTELSCGKHRIATPKFSSCTEKSTRLIITGSGGSGKSVLIRHLFLDCISQKKYIPLLLELRDLNFESISLDEFILETLETYGFSTNAQFVNKAKKEGHFCFFLDGYDEVNYSQRKKLIKQIKSISEKYRLCPIFISSRPDESFHGIDGFSIYQILPLTLRSASNLIKKLPYDEDIKTKFSSALEDGLFEKHESFLSNPLLLSIMLLTYGENAEIPSKLSIFYNQAYEALFQRHDANKAGYSRDRLTKLDIQDFSKVFSIFALQTYEKRAFKMPRTDCITYIEKSRDSLKKDFKPEDYLTDLLSAACLLVEDGLDIAFSHRSFQEYFVALHINNSAPEIQEKLINRYWKNMRSDNVILLLSEINQDLIERVLIVPKLEALFKEIGVKNNTIGITHATKYIKIAYKSLNIDKHSFTAAYTGIDASMSSIVHLTVGLHKAYQSPGSDYFDKYKTEMFEKYGDPESQETRHYQTKSLTYKSQIMADTLNSKGAFSISYLQAAFDTYKELKQKHDNQSSDLDQLLGI